MHVLAADIPAIHRILRDEFQQHRMPVVDLIETQTHDPYKVLISAILSARTKDQTTAAAAQRLFSVAPSFDELEQLSAAEIERRIFPAGFYRTKAKALEKLPHVLATRFGGNLPSTVEELTELPGVGRKTANLVVAIGFGKPAICVDIHVHRIFNRLGYLRTTTPLQTEMTLRKQLPVRYWRTINSYLVSFGQHTCTPTNPHCGRCPIYRFCRRVGVTTTHARQ